MAQILENNCNTTNLRPLEVICNPTNATNPETQDGSIQLFINGGTSPYTVSWENGSQGTYLGNLQSGNYVATVTDFYGDYTKTVTCTVGNDSFYLDEFIKCSDSFNPNIFVFYDGTSLDATKASQASESIRSWYQTKKINGFGGLLYEGVIGLENRNSENWLWWATYPYLGSLTGGTLSDGITEIKSFGISGESVNNSKYNPSWCQSDDNGKCVPNNPSFNFSNDIAGSLNSDIYKRINNGFTLTGPYGSNDTRSMGVPFSVTSSIIDENQNVYGDFIGGDLNYMCIIVTDESNGNTGLYHGDIGLDSSDNIDKNDLFTNPFVLTGTGWSATTTQEPSNRFTHDYESFLKIWEDIKNQGGRFEGFIYPVIEDKVDEIPFLQHVVAAVEGETISATTFEEKYGTDITDVGPQNLNLSALTITNVYSAMTATTTYQNLNPIYQNGGGLKNFDWQVNPNVTGFANGVIVNNLNDFFSGISLSDIKFYTEPIEGLTQDKVYKFTNTEGCYSYSQRLFYTGQTYSSLTTSNEYDECIKCQPSTPNEVFQPTLCFLSNEVQYEFTPTGKDGNDYFVWENDDNGLTLSYNTNLNRWQITPWSNIGVGNMIRNVNEVIPTGNFTNIGTPQPQNGTMSEGFCEGLPLSLSYVTSDESCRNSGNGSVILSAEGGTSPYQYRIQGVGNYPNYGPAIYNGLTYGNYFAEVEDSNGDTSSTTFTINQGETPVQYNVSLTFNVISAPAASGLVNYTYGVQVSPSLPSGVYLTMNLRTNHTRKYRDSGSATFSQTHTITENGTLNIPYNTSSTTTSTIQNGCTIEDVNQITEVFTQTTNTITLNAGDTITGNIIQNIPTIDGENSFCNSECRMRAEYITSVSVINLSINGTNCSTASFSNIPVGTTSVREDCFEPQP
jgi:hypothetical protein